MIQHYLLINTFPPNLKNLDSIPPLLAADADDDGDGACVYMIADGCCNCILFVDDRGTMFED